MKVSYKRDITKSFMCITCEDEWSSFEKELLVRSKIRGLLGVCVTSENDEAVCWYDITGKQDLNGILENKYIEKEMFLQLLICLCDVLEQMESYLLSVDALKLGPEYIFWDYKKQAYEFCYNPAKNQIADEFQCLMEFLLTKINHNDKEVVKIAYQVYDESIKAGYSILSVREKLLTEESGKENGGTESIEKEPDINNRFEYEKEDKTLITEQQGIPPVQEQPIKVIEKIKLKLNQIQLQDKIKKDGKGICQNIIKKFFPDIVKIKKEKNIKNRKERTVMPVVFEPEEQKIKSGRPTVLLSEQNKKLCGILKYEGEHCLGDLKINEFPYIIGKSEECQGRIENETISRQHAMITKVEDVYFIEDLNSSNGTKVGGKILDYKMKVSLAHNEVIEFADEKFRFI